MYHDSEYANTSYEAYNEVWEALDAGPCPAGHYCPPGTEDPVQCANASVRSVYQPIYQGARVRGLPCISPWLQCSVLLLPI